MMIYNSTQQSAPFKAPEICEHLRTAPLFRPVSFWHGDGSRIEFCRNSGLTCSTKLITNGGHATMYPTALVQAELDSVLSIRANGQTLANIDIGNLCLEIPAGWAVLTDDGLKMCSIEETVEQLQSMGYGAGDLGADLDDWIDRHSTVEIYGRLYTPSDFLQAMEPERLEDLETACMIEYLTDYGIDDIGGELDGVLWHWQEDDLVLRTVSGSIDAESYRTPCEMPNYIRDWEQWRPSVPMRLIVRNGATDERITMESDGPADAIACAVEYWGEAWEREMGDRRVCLKWGRLLFFEDDLRSWREIGMCPYERVTLVPDPYY